MLDFTTQYPQALLIVLDKNYRSQQCILDAAGESIAQNTERLIHRIPGLKKDIISQLPPLSSEERGMRGEVHLPTLYAAPTHQHEEIYLQETIQSYIAK